MRTRPTVLVTRPAGQADELVTLLDERGVAAEVVPTIAIEPAPDEPLDGALAALADVDWLVIPSANGAYRVLERIAARGTPIPDATSVAAVGPATAAVLEDAGVAVDHVPGRYLSNEIAAGLGDLTGRRVLLTRTDEAATQLVDELRRLGAVVTEAVAYHTVIGPAASRDRLRAALGTTLHGIAFTSASAVRGLLRLAGPVDRQRAWALPAFCIGPITADAAHRHNFDVTMVADEHTIPGLAEAIADHFRPQEDR